MRKIYLLCSIIVMFMSSLYVIVSANNYKVIVIDPGHGGQDGGATYQNIKESELNLSIAKKLKSIYEENGYRVIMTRSDNNSLCEGSFIKKEDMIKRVEIINNSNALYAISIHMNMFSDERYSGAQTFYSIINDDSLILAELIQTSIIHNLCNTNRKIVKRDNIYLLNKVVIPCVIVECGFLSNEIERNNLMNDEYQLKFAGAIYDGAVMMNI